MVEQGLYGAPLARDPFAPSSMSLPDGSEWNAGGGADFGGWYDGPANLELYQQLLQRYGTDRFNADRHLVVPDPAAYLLEGAKVEAASSGVQVTTAGHGLPVDPNLEASGNADIEATFHDFVNASAYDDGELAAAPPVMRSITAHASLGTNSTHTTEAYLPRRNATEAAPISYAGQIDDMTQFVPDMSPDRTDMRQSSSTVQASTSSNAEDPSFIAPRYAAKHRTQFSAANTLPSSDTRDFSDRGFWAAQVSYILGNGDIVHGTREQVLAGHPELENAILLDFGKWCWYRKPANPPSELGRPTAPKTVGHSTPAHTKGKPAIGQQPATMASLIGTPHARPAQHTMASVIHRLATDSALIDPHETSQDSEQQNPAGTDSSNTSVVRDVRPTCAAYVDAEAKSSTANAAELDATNLVGGNLLAKLDIEGDDLEEVEVDTIAAGYFAALTALYDRTPQNEKFSPAEKVEYLQKQDEALNEINNALSTDHGREMAMENCRQLACVTIDAHKIGIPNKVHAAWAKTKSKKVGKLAKLNPYLTCSERATAVQRAIAKNKRVALDVTSDAMKPMKLVLNPAAVVNARIDYCKSNFQRAQRNKQLAAQNATTGSQAESVHGSKGKRKRADLVSDNLFADSDDAPEAQEDQQPLMKKLRGVDHA